MNVTIPVGDGVPLVPVTVAVRVTLAPTTTLADEELSVVVVAVGGLTTTETTLDTEAALLVSPP